MALQRLREAAEKAKIELSSSLQVGLRFSLIKCLEKNIISLQFMLCRCCVFKLRMSAIIKVKFLTKKRE